MESVLCILEVLSVGRPLKGVQMYVSIHSNYYSFDDVIIILKTIMNLSYSIMKASLQQIGHSSC